MEHSKITCVGDFLKIVKALYPDDTAAYFRGQPSSHYSVNSSFCRLVAKNKPKGHDEVFSYRLSRKLFKEFKNNIHSYPESNLLTGYSLNDIDLMMIAQHYGLATRLIDWTKNPLVALYFATEGGNKDDYCSVYMIHNVAREHPMAVVSSHGFAAAVKNEQTALLEIYRLMEQNIMNLVSWDLIQEVNIIVNKNSSDEGLINPPIMINKDILAMSVSQNLHRLMDAGARCTDVVNLFQGYLLNSICGISSIKIYNDAKYVIEPLPLNSRIKNQQGVFVFSNELEGDVVKNESLDINNIFSSYDVNHISRAVKSKGVFRVDISREYSGVINRELGFYGVSKNFIYPELPSYTEMMQEKSIKQIISGEM